MSSEQLSDGHCKAGAGLARAGRKPATIVGSGEAGCCAIRESLTQESECGHRYSACVFCFGRSTLYGLTLWDHSSSKSLPTCVHAAFLAMVFSTGSDSN